LSIDDRNPADLMPLHEVAALIDGVVGRHRDDFGGHTVLRRQVQWIPPFSHASADDVPIGDHTNRTARLAAVQHGDFSTIAVDHHPRHVAQRRVWTTTRGILSHDFLDSHASPPADQKAHVTLLTGCVQFDIAQRNARSNSWVAFAAIAAIVASLERLQPDAPARGMH
jgi:hypothetical protein